jgi:hypothetical protein
MSRRTNLAVALTMGVTAAMLVAPPAQAAQPLCGSTVTTDTTLQANLSCPGASPALTLAKGVTLDLGGHALVGDGTGTGIEAAPEGATVRNGTVRGWDTGVTSDGVPADDSAALTLLVEDVRFTDNHFGLSALRGDINQSFWGPTVVRTSTFARNDTALLASWGIRSTVEDSTFSRNGTAIDTNEARPTVVGSTFRHNETALRSYLSVVAISDSVFSDNTTGIHAAITRLTLHSSIIRDSETAVDTVATRLSVEDSRLFRNGIAFTTDTSIGTIARNTFRYNDTGFQGTAAPPRLGSLTLQDNVFVRNGDGIITDPTGEDWTTLELGGNRADRNDGWGIYAPGVTDLGGNTARGNTNEPQCTGVVCAPRRS